MNGPHSEMNGYKGMGSIDLLHYILKYLFSELKIIFWQNQK